MAVDVRRSRLNMAVINTRNDIWIQLPKEGFIEKKRKVRRVCRCVHRRNANVAIARQMRLSGITRPETFSSGVRVKDDACINLSNLNINSDSVTDDQELVTKMATLSCNQNSRTNWYEKRCELAEEWKKVTSDFLVEKIDAEISNLKIDEVDNEKNSEMSVNPFR